MSEAPAFRPLPDLEPDTEFFWTSGQDGRLRFLRCQDCGTYIHPPRPRCLSCRSERVEPEVVSGLATVASFTINHQPWLPNMDVPFAIAIVEIDEQPTLRLMTNIVGCEADEVAIGMRVRVVFEERDDVWLPLFEPADESRGDAS